MSNNIKRSIIDVETLKEREKKVTDLFSQGFQIYMKTKYLTVMGRKKRSIPFFIEKTEAITIRLKGYDKEEL